MFSKGEDCCFQRLFGDAALAIEVATALTQEQYQTVISFPEWQPEKRVKSIA